MPNPTTNAEELSYDDFMGVYTPTDVTYESAMGTPLLGAAGNFDPEARVAIANQLLDDGADASFSLDDGGNVFHTLFSMREHDFPAEAALVTRLLAGGADINQASTGEGPPLLAMVESGTASRDRDGLLIDAILASTTVDLDVAVGPAGRPHATLREAITKSAWKIPALQKRLNIRSDA